jgi:hypothetical protein
MSTYKPEYYIGVIQEIIATYNSGKRNATETMKRIKQMAVLENELIEVRE